MLGPGPTRKAAAPNFDCAQQEDNPQPEFGVLGQASEERDVREHQAADQWGQHAGVRPRAGIDEEFEVADEVRIGELVEA